MQTTRTRTGPSHRLGGAVSSPDSAWKISRRHDDAFVTPPATDFEFTIVYASETGPNYPDGRFSEFGIATKYLSFRNLALVDDREPHCPPEGSRLKGTGGPGGICSVLHHIRVKDGPGIGESVGV